MWILTQSYNDHNQHGDYFVAAFTDKPTEDDIKKTLEDECNLHLDLCEHILKGGGKRKHDFYYFNLIEVTSGERVG